MSYPYLNAIELDREKAIPVYLQIAQGLSCLIKQGILKPGQKLPGSRLLAEKLQVNRNTITLATDELQAEGWVVAKSRSGLYVNEMLPLIKRSGDELLATDYPHETGFDLAINNQLEAPEVSLLKLQLDDGCPDPRLSPLHELGREYHRLLKKTNPLHLFGYNDAQGDSFFRQIVSQQLNEFRGLKTKSDDIFISRGSIMGIYLIVQATLKPGDKVVVGELNYRTANLCFEHAGATLVRIPVDEKGINTHALEEVLKKHHIRLLYITSHHHHPTTVTLAPERRIHLYELAKKHRFLILEDDYDFDYHYENKPTMPIASMDTHGLVVYVGSYSKVIYPGIRVGFVVAQQNLIREMIKYRRIIDRQGDHLIERSIANLLYDGTLQRYLRKSKSAYKKRKEFFCDLLRKDFNQYLDFQEPEGGMAVWVTFKNDYHLPEISRRCLEKKLYVSNGNVYCPPGMQINACRMGFSSMTEEEIAEACKILKEVLEGM